MLQDEYEYDLYAKLWRLRPTDVWKPSSEDAPTVHVQYRGPDFVVGYEAGLFLFVPTSDGSERPLIWIRRTPCPVDLTEPDVTRANMSELCTLAHERGHEASWRAGTYESMTMSEERHAWEHADRILRDLGFKDWCSFEVAKNYSLEMHAKMGTPEYRSR